HPHLLVQTGKEGKIYLLDRDDLGQYRRKGDNSDDIVGVAPQNITGVWGSPAFFNGVVYYHGRDDVMRGIRVTNGRFAGTVTPSNVRFTYPGGQPTISANGTSSGIVWELQTDSYASNGPAILHAYDATNLAQELYRSDREAVSTAASA